MYETREEQLKRDMDPDTNALIPGGKAAKVVETNALNVEKGVEADNRRLMSPWYNPFIPGSPRQSEFQ